MYLLIGYFRPESEKFIEEYIKENGHGNYHYLHNCHRYFITGEKDTIPNLVVISSPVKEKLNQFMQDMGSDIFLDGLIVKMAVINELSL